MNFSLSRNWRRGLRVGAAVVGAIAAGTIQAPDYFPIGWHHAVQQTCLWLVGVFGVINPFLDLGADDAKGDASAPK